MNTAGSKGALGRITEIDELLKHKARQYQDGNQRTATIARDQMNQLLEERRELLQSLGKEVPSDDTLAMLDNTTRISSNSVLIGNLMVSAQRAGIRNKTVKKRYCERCSGLINYNEVYPDFEAKTRELNFVGCGCS